MKEASAGTLRLTFERAGAVSVVRAEGEIDLDNADQLSSALRTASGADDQRVVLDLLGVPFMDSSGLKALLVASADLGDRLGLVLSPGAPVARLLDLAEVTSRFDIHADLEAALGST